MNLLKTKAALLPLALSLKMLKNATLSLRNRKVSSLDGNPIKIVKKKKFITFQASEKTC